MSPDPEEVRRELEALTAQTARLDMLDLDLADDRVEYQAIVFLLEDRAALARRAGFADAQIGELAGVSPRSSPSCWTADRCARVCRRAVRSITRVVGPPQATARQIARARELLTVLGLDSDGPHGFAARAAAGEVTHEEAGMFILALDAERQRRGLADPGEPAH